MTLQVRIVPKGYEEDQMAHKKLADVLIRLNQVERKNNAIARFNLPEALNGLKSGVGPQLVQIIFFSDGDESQEELRRKLQDYFPRELVRDVTMENESIYAKL